MEIIEKPSKMKLRSVVTDYFARYPYEKIVGLLTKEGREFWFRRDPLTGEPIKISRVEAEQL